MMLQDDVIKRPTMNENHAKIDQIWHSYLFHVFICSSLSVLTNNLSLCSYLWQANTNFPTSSNCKNLILITIIFEIYRFFSNSQHFFFLKSKMCVNSWMEAHFVYIHKIQYCITIDTRTTHRQTHKNAHAYKDTKSHQTQTRTHADICLFPLLGSHHLNN